MAEDLLNLQLTDQAQIALSTLRAEERRLVQGWFEHLRNWHHDEFIRDRSRRLNADEPTYVFQTADLLIAFEIVGNTVTVLALFRPDALRTFTALTGRSTP
jgi:hypothetical protein